MAAPAAKASTLRTAYRIAMLLRTKPYMDPPSRLRRATDSVTTVPSSHDRKAHRSGRRDPLAEVLGQHLAPGRPVVVPGRAPRVDAVGHALAAERVGHPPRLA